MMKRKIPIQGMVFDILIGGAGLVVPLYFTFLRGFPHPPLLHYLFILGVSLFLAYNYVSYDNTIVSFEILLYFFLYLSFGYLLAALTSFLVIFLLWSFYTIREIVRGSMKEALDVMRRGFFNAGNYGLTFFLAGIIANRFRFNIYFYFGISIVLLMFLNELILFLDTFLYKGNLSNFKHIEYWRSSLLEALTYSIGISLYHLYGSWGIVSTLPIIFLVILLSYFGKSLDKNKEKLLKRLKYMEDMNRVLRILSSILDLDTLLESIVKQTYRFFNARFITLCISEEDIGTYTVYFDGNKVTTELGEKPCSMPTSKSISREKKEVIFPISKGGGVMGEIKLLLNEVEEEKIDFIDVLSKNIGISITNALLHRISIEDSLTGLYTRRFFDKRLREEFNRAERSGEPLTLLMFDLDDFKKLNDTYGHDMGDMALILFTSYLKKYTRTYDTAARWGGDEFVVLLPRTDKSEAEAFMQRILKETRKTKIEHNNEFVTLSASAGIAEYDPKSNSDMSPKRLISLADRRLLEAKRKHL